MAERILVVDDEADVRLLLRSILEKEGWDVDEADSGFTALDRCRATTFDIVVLDSRMPGLTGMETARKLREDGYDASILLYSAYLSPAVRAEARELGMPAIDKPDFSALLATLRELREKRSS